MKLKPGHPSQRRKRVTQELRREIVLRWKLSGATDRDIAQRLQSQFGVKVSHVTVNSDWKAALAASGDLTDKDRAEMRTLIISRYERLIEGHWWKAIAGSAKAGDQVHKSLKALREMNGLDRELGTEDNPLTFQYGDVEYDYSRLTDEQLEDVAALEEAARIVRGDTEP